MESVPGPTEEHAATVRAADGTPRQALYTGPMSVGAGGAGPRLTWGEGETQGAYTSNRIAVRDAGGLATRDGASMSP